MKDKYNLERFVKAQNKCYDAVLNELNIGKKQTHWMWYVFPQIIGLGKSEVSQYYAIKSIGEAKEYMNNPILNRRMNEVCNILLSLNSNDSEEIFGYVDSMKFKSSMTLFDAIYPNNPLFMNILKKYYAGEKDINTILIIDILYRKWIEKKVS